MAPKSAGKGKQPKHFLDQTAALGLAESIAASQEQKAQKKVEKRAQIAHAQPQPRTAPRISESRIKLKKTKALIASKVSETKKARKKRRKELEQSSSSRAAPPSPPPPSTKKSVSFA
ncbi:hypothetical protein C8F01DRAFT_1137508 [Mycena amicta]|nr:hypothetical protein C8F01DRAFT_1137508 [Mycena amicta]